MRTPGAPGSTVLSRRAVLIWSGQLEVKRTALAESVRRGNSLEKVNATHMQKYAEMSRKNEAIEKVCFVLSCQFMSAQR